MCTSFYKDQYSELILDDYFNVLPLQERRATAVLAAINAEAIASVAIASAASAKESLRMM